MTPEVQAFLDQINQTPGWHAEVYTGDNWFVHVSLTQAGKSVEAIIGQDSLDKWPSYKAPMEKAMQEALEK